MLLGKNGAYGGNQDQRGPEGKNGVNQGKHQHGGPETGGLPVPGIPRRQPEQADNGGQRHGPAEPDSQVAPNGEQGKQGNHNARKMDIEQICQPF